MMNSYPNDLVPIIKKACKAKEWEKYDRTPPLPPDGVILSLLDVAYHASFDAEEGRRPGFRLILYSPEDHKKATDKNAPEWLTMDFILGLFGKKLSSAQRSYREFVEGMIRVRYCLKKLRKQQRKFSKKKKKQGKRQVFISVTTSVERS